MNMSSSSTALYQGEYGNASPPRCALMDDADSQEMGIDCQLPPFNPQDPRQWFREAEDIFIEKNIPRQASKFYHVVQILPIELSGPAFDLLYPSGFVQNVYDKLRDQVIAEYERQQTISTQKILQGLENRYHGKRKHDKIAPVVPYGRHFAAEMKHDTGALMGPKMKHPRISIGK